MPKNTTKANQNKQNTLADENTAMHNLIIQFNVIYLLVIRCESVSTVEYAVQCVEALKRVSLIWYKIIRTEVPVFDLLGDLLPYNCLVLDLFYTKTSIVESQGRFCD